MHVSVLIQVTKFILCLFIRGVWSGQTPPSCLKERLLSNSVLTLRVSVPGKSKTTFLRHASLQGRSTATEITTPDKRLSQSHWDLASASAVSVSCGSENTFGSSSMLSSRLTGAGLGCHSTRGIRAIWKSLLTVRRSISASKRYLEQQSTHGG
jgi:hypothetical protein